MQKKLILALATLAGSACFGAFDVRAAQISNAPTAVVAGDAVAASACASSISRLKRFSKEEPAVRAVLEEARKGMTAPPAWALTPSPWLNMANVDDLVNKIVLHAVEWCQTLPRINGSKDDGLAHILQMTWFFYKNPAGVLFSSGRDLNNQPFANGFDYFKEFSREVGAFMDSPASTVNIAEWIANPRTEIDDYLRTRAEEYKSWNDFFVREIKVDPATQTIPSRPTARPEADYVISSPADCIVNPVVQVIQRDSAVERRYVESPIQLSTVLDIKGIPIGVRKLLGSAPDDLINRFEGGSGLSCVLLPANYHHYHAPVSGTVLHAEIVNGKTFGYEDVANMLPRSLNVAQPGMDFSQFETYQRGVIIFEVKYMGADKVTPLTGYVAQIPVGLDTVGSVVLDPELKPGMTVKRGFTRIGHFKYGGSINVLLFSKGMVYASVQTRLGSQIGTINTQ